MKGFVVEIADNRLTDDGLVVAGPGPFEPVVFCHSQADAAFWALKHLCTAQVSYRVLPGIAAPRHFNSGEFEIARAH